MSANPQGITMPRAERHAHVKRLKETGLTFTDIADYLGLARSTVTSAYYDPSGEQDRARKRKVHGNCRDCGRKTFNSGSAVTRERCSDCRREYDRSLGRRREVAARERGRVRWTDDQIFAALRSLAVEGRITTTIYDEAQQNGMHGKIPSRPTIVWRYGSWRNAVHAAGLRLGNEGQPASYANRIPDDGLLSAIEDCAAELGWWPGGTAYDAWCRGRAPRRAIIAQRFGSWLTALEAAMERNGGQVPA